MHDAVNIPIPCVPLHRAKYMRIPFQAIHVSWAHAFPVFSDIPDIHVLRTFFSSNRVHAFAVRMETCCRAAVTFSEPYSYPYSSHGLLDTLVSACNSGLFMAVPIAIYPNRQSWLNGTNLPYYPFSYSMIDYPSLVSFIPDEPYPPQSDQTTTNTNDEAASQHGNGDALVRGGMPHYRGRGRAGGHMFATRRPFVWHPRFSGYGRGGKFPSAYQKENQQYEMALTNGDAQSSVSSAGIVQEPRRKPLSSHNMRGSSSNGFRSTSIRGRGSAKPRS